jgi:hypothetical protein
MSYDVNGKHRFNQPVSEFNESIADILVRSGISPEQWR